MSQESEGAFPATAWSRLLQVHGPPEASRNAWEQLARSYWQPLYVFLRRRGLDHHSAADDIQGFFAYLLNQDFSRRIERGDGLFRSFLLTTLQNWRTDNYRATKAQKRGGHNTVVSLEELEAIRATPSSNDYSSEEAFDRRWARSVFENALANLHSRFKERGRDGLFLELHGLLSGQHTAKYQEIASALNMSEGSVK